MVKPDVPSPPSRPQRDVALLAIYLLGSLLLTLVLFPRALHEDLRLLGPGIRRVPGQVISVTGSRRVRISSVPGAILRGAPPPTVAQRRNPAARPGSPVRLHRYDFEFTTAADERVHGFTFGGGRYAPGDRVQVRYLEKNPDLNCLSGTTRDPEPAAALVLVFPLIGLFAACRLYARHRAPRTEGPGCGAA